MLRAGQTILDTLARLSIIFYFMYFFIDIKYGISYFESIKFVSGTKTMSLREKRAWVTLITLIAVLLLFWLHIPPGRMLAPEPSMFVLHVLMLMITFFVTVEIIAHIVFRIRSPRDARTPKDERERLIELRSREVAWYVYVILSIGGIFLTLHMGANEIGIGFVVLLALVIAEIVNYALRIYYYRRGF